MREYKVVVKLEVPLWVPGDEPENAAAEAEAQIQHLIDSVPNACGVRNLDSEIDYAIEGYDESSDDDHID